MERQMLKTVTVIFPSHEGRKMKACSPVDYHQNLNAHSHSTFYVSTSSTDSLSGFKFQVPKTWVRFWLMEVKKIKKSD